jgi:ATP-dependent exoDNAse (exonuclease V) beta subunit
MPLKVYRSSAGSGKTFTLVKEYLRVALASERPDAYRGILAVTFTNKAAEEMKTRVLSALQKLSTNIDSDEPLTKLLLHELDVSIAVLSERSAKTLKHMLHHYSDVSISTIDRFSHRLIRTFAHDLGISVNFEVELDQDVIQQAILDELMQKVGSDKLLTDALVDLIQSSIDDERGWNLDKQVKDFTKVLFTEESRFHLEHLRGIEIQEFGQIRKRLKTRIDEAKQELRNLSGTVLRQISDHNLSPQSFWHGSGGIFGYLTKLRNGKFELPGVRIQTTINDDKWYGPKVSIEEKAGVDNLKPAIIKCVERASELVPPLLYHELVFKHVYGVALLDEMHQILKAFQTAEEIVHIGEFNHLISDKVMVESAPFIYERMGAKYHHFLVDEFQDTSILQWFNLLPLIDESLAHDNLCLVVGDGKQSIYRWRGGDVQQFVELPELHKPAYFAEKLNSEPEMKNLFETRERILHSSFSEFPLGTNYRSSSNIIQFNNKLFEFLQDLMPETLRKMYDNGAQKVNRKANGLVTIKMLRPPESASDKSWPEYQALVLEQMKVWVDECLADGYPPGDIAIIFRTNKDAVQSAQFLLQNGYDVVSSESLLINSSAKVRLLVNVATFLVNPSDSINVAELLQNLDSEKNGLSESFMSCKGARDSKYIQRILSEHYSTIDWQSISKEAPFNLFSMLCHGIFGNDTEPNLTFFLDEVLSFGQTKKRSLEDFLAHWKENRHKLSIALEESQESIRILTIHKSKGLEFPVVIHPYADYPTSNKSTYGWVYLEDDELKPLDRLRISMTKSVAETPFKPELELEQALSKMDMFNELYVALTRAKNRLYVSGKLKKSPKGDSSPNSAIQYVQHYLTSSSLLAPDEELFISGTREKHEIKPITKAEITLEKSGDPYWRKRLSLARPISDSSVELSEISARQLGIAVHDAMARIRTAKDVDYAVQVLVEEGKIPVEDVERISSHIHNLIRNPKLSELFEANKVIRNEADIQVATGQWLRPDRVVIDGSKAWVIDYKTGEERPEHRKQIENYKHAITELGFGQVEGMLVYIESDNLVTV